MVVWATGHVGALTASADTLPGALIQAYVNNPQLNSQRAVVRATDEGVPQALSGYKPRVTANGSIGQQYTTGVSKTVIASGPLAGTPNYPRVGAGYTPSSVGVTSTKLSSTACRPPTGPGRPSRTRRLLAKLCE
jgi:outer membrane protein